MKFYSILYKLTILGLQIFCAFTLIHNINFLYSMLSYFGLVVGHCILTLCLYPDKNIFNESKEEFKLKIKTWEILNPHFGVGYWMAVNIFLKLVVFP